DVLALLPMLRELRAASPEELTLVVSVTTSTGRAMAESRLGGHADALTFLPYDLPGATRRAVGAIAPDLLVLEYTEIWPNLIGAARRAGASVALTNGRFSAERLGRYRLL